MFAFMAYGNLNPFMRHLERRKGYIITIVNSPLNIQKLKSSLPATANIRLAEIPFNVTNDGLPQDAENADTLPYEFVVPLLKASENLESPSKNLILNIAMKEVFLCALSPIPICSRNFQPSSFEFSAGKLESWGTNHRLAIG
ncbi:hypothetical protein REPUB_Repub04eG0036300 [Reevesia pubescens]